MKAINPENYRSKYTYKNRNSYKLPDAVDYYKLEAPPQLKEMTEEEVPYFWNGIGGKGCWYNKLIPNTVYRLDISLASGPHDIAYHFGFSETDRKLADKQFLRNMCKIIEKESTFWTKWTGLDFLRKRRAYKYYLAVRIFGGKAFWENK